MSKILLFPPNTLDFFFSPCHLSLKCHHSLLNGLFLLDQLSFLIEEGIDGVVELVFADQVCLLLLDELIQLLHIHLLQFFQLSPLLSLLSHQILCLPLNTLQFFHFPIEALRSLLASILDDTRLYD